jgi:hypothetical protein
MTTNLYQQAGAGAEASAEAGTGSAGPTGDDVIDADFTES